MRITIFEAGPVRCPRCSKEKTGEVEEQAEMNDDRIKSKFSKES